MRGPKKEQKKGMDQAGGETDVDQGVGKGARGGKKDLCMAMCL